MINICRRALTHGDNIFDSFVQYLQDQPHATISDINNNKKRKGDIWESFCKAYLIQTNIYTTVKLLAEASEDELKQWSLTQKDVGIDIIAVDYDETHTQSNASSDARGGVTWRELSTFIALCARTGPWSSHVVMTNAKYVKREGTASHKDKSICYATFCKLKRHDWCAIANLGDGYKCGHVTQPLNMEELRLQRLSALNKSNTSQGAFSIHTHTTVNESALHDRRILVLPMQGASVIRRELCLREVGSYHWTVLGVMQISRLHVAEVCRIGRAKFDIRSGSHATLCCRSRTHFIK